ncbi:MAG TPA: two-component system VirA-like sensor kinase [Alphaproteobacteria bacterium]
MRLTPGIAAVPLLLVLLTWLSLRAVDTDAERYDRALEALDYFAIVENALHRDVLTARSGMLRHYDSLVREVGLLNDAVDRLRATAATDAETTAAIDRLAASVGREEELVEQFKSNNALLQNSLAYFGLFSGRLGAPSGNEPQAPAVSALAAAMLRLTLDTSAAVIREVDSRLNEVAWVSPKTEDLNPTHALLAHGRLLRDLLPRTDDVVKSLFAVPSGPQQNVIRTMVLSRQSASREAARRFRFLLYATSVLLVAVLVQLGLRLRTRALALQHRAAFEHLIAGISTGFINARPHEIGIGIEGALAELAERVGADRAYVVLARTPIRMHAWCRDGLPFPPGWPAQVPALVAQFRPSDDGIVHVRSVDALPSGPGSRALVEAGLRSWTCVTRTDEDGVSWVLGFDVLRQRDLKHDDDLGLLRLAFNAITNAIRREVLERERTCLERRLEQARRMETVGTLASGVAHNFNNIIGAILGHVEMADEQVASESRMARNHDAIRRAGERARDLVDQILTYSRHRDVRRRAVSVQALISEAATLLLASLPSTIELVIRDATQPATVSGQHAQLQQVIVNLCNNAAQAMDGSGRVEIETEIHEIASSRSLTHGRIAPGRYLRIAVSDTGRGMTEATLDRIFEPFFTTRAAGYGLGLATVREIVREHAGAMHVVSTPGVGSCFEVWLPSIPPSETATREDDSTLRLGRGETLLVVDDDRQRLLAIEDMLAALGYEPVGFSRAADALAACRATPERFDALVVGRPFRGLAAALRDVAPRLPIVLTTASAEEIGTDALAAMGISEVVHRPLSSSEIAAALSRCLAGRANSPGARQTQTAEAGS